MPFFVPDIVLPNDPAGFGRWLTGHYLEHKAFVAKGAANTPVITIPDFDILAWSDDPVRARFWLDSHASIHNQLRAPVGLSGIDLSAVDFGDPEEFNEWLSLHATEHSELRQLYGIT